MRHHLLYSYSLFPHYYPCLFFICKQPSCLDCLDYTKYACLDAMDMMSPPSHFLILCLIMECLPDAHYPWTRN